MKKEKIEELYYLYSNDMYVMNDEIQAKTQEILKLDETLKKSISDEQSVILDKLIEVETERGELVDKNIFVYAFSLATQLFVESLNDNKKNSNNRKDKNQNEYRGKNKRNKRN